MHDDLAYKAINKLVVLGEDVSQSSTSHTAERCPVPLVRLPHLHCCIKFITQISSSVACNQNIFSNVLFFPQ